MECSGVGVCTGGECDEEEDLPEAAEVMRMLNASPVPQNSHGFGH
jgi:hypothetical protein